MTGTNQEDLTDLQAETKARWDDLSQAGLVYSKPWLDLTMETARQRVDRFSNLGELSGLRALLLASGGGQQSAALALLGADVTVHDISESQLKNDALAFEKYGLSGRLVLGDMCNLKEYEDSEFDLVLQRYSINYVPQVDGLFREVARVLAPDGVYHLQWSNPFNKTLEEETWTGRGYLLDQPYRSGEIKFADSLWRFASDSGQVCLPRPTEFNHKLSSVVNGLVGAGLRITGLFEDDDGEGCEEAEPGSYAHMLAFSPPYLVVQAILDQPNNHPERGA